MHWKAILWRCCLAVVWTLHFALTHTAAQESKDPSKEPGAESQKEPGKEADKGAVKTKDDADKLPLTKLAPAKLIPDLCLLKYHITTSSPECQAFFDQGLGYFYSYVWMEAARSFETAAKYDPNCAMAWWGLSRAIEKWGKNNHAEALK